MLYWSRFCLAGFCLVTLAASAGELLRWRCWYDQKTHIACLVDTVPQSGPSLPEATLPANLPPVVQELRLNPAAFQNRIVHVPLHTAPLDMEFTSRLATAAMCGSRTDCSVRFTARVPSASEIQALMNKPLRNATALEAIGMQGP